MDNQIIRKEIERMLDKSTFVLTELEYDSEVFGTIIAVLYNGSKEYHFGTSRGEIWCDHQLIYSFDFHVAGVDDTPIYLMKAIQQVIDEKKVALEQCLPLTQYIFSKLTDLIDPEKIFLSADSLVYKGKTQHFNSVYLDKENKISFDVYDNDDVSVFYLDYDSLMMKMDGDSAYTQADIAANTLRNVLTCPMKVVRIYQGNKLKKQVLYFLEDYHWVKSGTISYSLVNLFNPFDKKRIEEQIYDFKKSNKTYIHRLKSVKEVIDHWDPIDLLAFAPKDEYHSEIMRIEQLLGKTEDVLVLSEGIYKIFVDSFGVDIFQKSLSECTQIAEMLLSQKPRIQFVESPRALQIIEDCKSKKIRILGIDGFKVTPTSTQPFMEHSVDYSDKKEAWDDAIAFVQSKSDLGLMFEVVCEDELSSISLDRNSKLSHFEKGDGWVLCSLSEKFYPLKSIISTGDILNHSIFTYDELNKGLLRLIQNGYAEQFEGKFRITKKGKALIHKLSFPQSLLNGSITNMLLVDEKIVNVLTEVEVNYTIDAISVDEYRKAINAHWSFCENWLKNNK